MVTSNLSQQPLYILHRQPYQEDGALVDGFSPSDGRIRIIARGLRRKRNPLAPLLQPFVPLSASWQLKGELGKLNALEAAGPAHPLSGDPLYAGFYLNELLLRLLPLQAGCDTLFSDYCQAIAQLVARQIEPALRRFEQALLYEIGAGSASEIFACQDVYAEQTYLFQPGQGLLASSAGQRGGLHAPGWQFAAIAKNDFTDPQVLKLAKRLNRVRLTPLLGNKPLKSRALWIEMRNRP